MKLLIAIMVAVVGTLPTGSIYAATTILTSPNAAIVVSIDDGGGKSGPTFKIDHAGVPLIAPSPLGISLSGAADLHTNLTIAGSSTTDVDRIYDLFAGKTKTVREHYRERTIDLKEPFNGRRLQLIVRAYDDGVALRYRIPSQPIMEPLTITGEYTGFNFPFNYECWGLDLGRFGTSHEGEFNHIPASQIHEYMLFDTPLVCQSSSGATFALAQSNVKDYSSLYFTGRWEGGLGVSVRLSPRVDNPAAAVEARIGTDVVTPWRVVMVSPTAAKLVESNLIEMLADPSVIKDTSWIKPGKTAWDWWSGPVVSGVKKSGMNDETIKRFIDFSARQHLDYMLIDEGWYAGAGGGGRVKPGVDVTRTIAAIHLPELVAYAAARHVGLWLWLNWQALDAQLDDALTLYEKWGIKGIKVDFMDRDDQQMVDYYHRLLSKAASHHLMVNLHGAFPPVGLARTYPNFLTQEGVLGAEYNKGSARVTASHNVTLALTRGLLGPMDYTPGGFRNVAPGAFVARGELPMVQTTRGQALAMYVVYDSPFTALADSPDTYEASPAGLDFVSSVPTTWDETRGIAGIIGKFVVVARRKGCDWYVGAMTNEAARKVSVPLDFLPPGVFTAVTWQDGAKPDTLSIDQRVVDAHKTLPLSLAPSGGAAVRLSPLGSEGPRTQARK